MKKKTIIIISAAVLIVLIVLAIMKSKGVIGGDQSPKVATDMVARRTIVETVSANGKIQPAREVKITPYISGEVVELHVREGDQVKGGDLLAKIDPEIYLSNYERMEASLQSQKASLANAKARLAQTNAQFTNSKLSFERNEKLWKEKVISDADYETAKANFEVTTAEVQAAEESVKAAEFQVASAEASLREARENLTKTAIYAPSDGTVSRLIIEKGERVAGASQFSAGTELMRIADLDLMEAVVQVNENDIVRISLGDTSLIEVDAYLNRKFKGLVTEIATSAETAALTSDQVTSFEVKIRLLKESYQDLLDPEKPWFSPFRPGMSTTVDIQTKTEFNVLTLPIQAVTTRSDTTGKEVSARIDRDKNKDEKEKDKNEKVNTEITEYVFVYDNGKAKMIQVKSGIQDNTYIQILSGLEENAEVIIGPYRAVSRSLKNGDQVKKVPKEELFE
ncbi:MAG: efflux RND transporter periplasmic adaptor subunit [Bacteroidales bacterium]|nr:efflux RND transporter periplasmic adaptor subunit [Bacteroidales bacterium]